MEVGVVVALETDEIFDGERNAVGVSAQRRNDNKHNFILDFYQVFNFILWVGSRFGLGSTNLVAYILVFED